MNWTAVTLGLTQNIFDIQSTLALRTPRYNGHPDNTDSSKIPGKNKLQTFD